MNQKGFIQIPLLILIIGGLLFIAQPTQAGFFDWFSWSKVKSIFIREQTQEMLPASVSEPIKEIEKEPAEIPEAEISGKNLLEYPTRPTPQTCETKTITKEVQKEVIKEVPKEVVIYKDFKDDPTYKATSDVFNRCQEGLREYEKGYALLQQELASSTQQIKELQSDYIKLFNNYKSLKSSAYSLIDKIQEIGNLTSQITSQQISNSLFFKIVNYNYTIFTQDQLFQPVYNSDSIVSSTQAIIDGFK